MKTAHRLVEIGFAFLLLAGNACESSPKKTDTSPLPNSSTEPSASNPMNMPGPLSIIELSASLPQLTDSGSVRINAKLARSGGYVAFNGGRLMSLDRTIKYGDFIFLVPANFFLDLTWKDLHAAEAISFDKQGTRSFLAEFSDVQGNTVTGTLDLTLTCNGDPACAGKCIKAGLNCDLGTSQLCVAGICSDGCYISGSLKLPVSVPSSGV